MFGEVDDGQESFFEKNIVNIISLSLCVIVIIVISTFVIQIQTGEMLARQAQELKHLRVQQIIDGKRIAELELERGERQMKKVGK